MTYTHSSGTQKITLRLFAIFALFILLPTAALSGFAIFYINSESRDQVERMLVDEASVFRSSLLERLSVIEERLILFSTRIQYEGSSAPLNLSSQGLDVQYRAFDPDLLARSANASAMEIIRAGRALIVSITEEQTTLIIRAVNPDNLQLGLVTGILSNNLLLGEPDLRDLRFDYCIYDGGGLMLFYSSRGVCDGLGNMMGDYQGITAVSQEDISYIISYKQVFMTELYGNENWIVAAALPKSNVLESSRLFEKRYLTLAVITILSLAMVSIRLIRRQMAPLKNIMQGIERVSSRDYKHRVEVQSGDEFEDMAFAFNSMSERVSHQMLTMSSMSEIDQLILSRVKKEDIIRIALERTADVISGGPVFMIVMEKEAPAAELFFWEDDAETLASINILLTEQQIKKAFTTDFYVLSPTDALARSISVLTRHRESSYCLVLPIRLKNELLALLLITRQECPQFDADQETVMHDYGSRIAVALANAEWEDRLYRQAHFDMLTGLPNRHALRDHLDQIVARARRGGETFGVLFIDLDNFKLINDSLGHSLGDEFLQEIASRLSSALREGDFVSRLGGDEFVIVSSSNLTNGRTVSSMNEIVRRVQVAASTPHNLRGHELRSSSSIGVALYPKDGEDTESLLKNADAAMYQAKAEGSGSFNFFSEDLSEQSHTLMQLSMELQTALEHDQFRMHFQPKVDVASGTIIGAEALIRWYHPIRGMVSPGQFIEAAETLGLMNALGDWVLNSVCKQLKEWEQSEASGLRVAVNISAAQIQKKGFVEKIQSLLHTYQISGDVLELEITEGAIIDDIPGTVAKLEMLRSMGISISIDDYGTGYSSLEYLKQFPVDTLKIDFSFIVNLCSSVADQAIVESTILLAQRLGLKTVAEGVEEAGQVALLKQYNCDQIQGYFYSRPIPAAEFAALLASGPANDDKDFGLHIANDT